VLYGTTPGFLERLGLPSLASLPSLAPLLGLDAEEAIADEPAPVHDPSVDLTGTVSDDVGTVEIEPGSSDDAPV
jgi:hypothetical protein